MKLKTIFILLVISLFLLGLMIIYEGYVTSKENGEPFLKDKIIPEDGLSIKSEILRFKSADELVNVLKESVKIREYAMGGVATTASFSSPSFESVGKSFAKSTRDYSETNIQVEGVDEADIIKTDGDYIYVLAQGNLIIAKAYPSYSAKIISKINLGDLNANDIFIDNDRILIFGSKSYRDVSFIRDHVGYSYDIIQTTTVELYNIKDKENPVLLRRIDFEGNYLTSRKINSDVYFVINNPLYYPIMKEGLIPLYRDSNDDKEFIGIVDYTDVGYVKPIQADNFITIASISMDDENKAVKKEVIVGSGQNVYASLNNLYIAQTSWNRYNEIGELIGDNSEKTVITKFRLSDGEIKFIGTGKVNGHILNQFSMDEYDNYFRIATTIGQVSRSGGGSSNNVYVLDEELNVVGELEDLASGEKIYSVRFMGKKGYVVTFKKVDPLFVIDLSDYDNPSVLGKLKIPGYSDYLHPYDENHIIGIGKETIEAEEGDFAWYQGLKMAIFDVSDIENPIEMHKVVIGDRGTDSDVLRDHKAFLFDKEKNLLVIPITLAEIKGEKTEDNQYGEFTFQGVYVYDVTLKNGFELKGRITHYDDDEIFKKSGYYFNGDSSIKRSLYIENVLYTLSEGRLQLNNLNSLDKLKVLKFSSEKMNNGGVLIEKLGQLLV